MLLLTAKVAREIVEAIDATTKDIDTNTKTLKSSTNAGGSSYYHTIVR